MNVHPVPRPHLRQQFQKVRVIPHIPEDHPPLDPPAP